MRHRDYHQKTCSESFLLLNVYVLSSFPIDKPKILVKLMQSAHKELRQWLTQQLTEQVPIHSEHALAQKNSYPITNTGFSCVDKVC